MFLISLEGFTTQMTRPDPSETESATSQKILCHEMGPALPPVSTGTERTEPLTTVQ